MEASKLSYSFGTSVPYKVPSWISSGDIDSSLIPKERLQLGRFPTPVHAFALPGTKHTGLDFHIMRDDLSSFDLTGNKIRKLEFQLAEAKSTGCDCVISIGGLQSNHTRATAMAARQVGLDPYMILIKPPSAEGVNEEDEVGLTGNLLFQRMISAELRLVSPAEYAQYGAQRVCEQLAEDLRKEGRTPYVVPMGGSNALGVWGYLQCVNEIVSAGELYDHIVFGCGSGGTAAGLALGVKLAGLPTQLHAIGVQESAEFFYGHVMEMAAAVGLDTTTLGGLQSWLHIHRGAECGGLGSASMRPTTEELSYLIQVAHSTGIIVDPIFSCKGLYYFVHTVLKQEGLFTAGQKVLYIHTGGTLGLYEKEKELVPLLPGGKICRMTDHPAQELTK